MSGHKPWSEIKHKPRVTSIQEHEQTVRRTLNLLRAAALADMARRAELTENACEQALLLLERPRFRDDTEAKVVRAVLRAALAAARNET